eukprot:PhF_6_TR6231/c1_g1_i1/m.9414
MSSQGHRHVGNGTQNQGNVLGSRPCVRQSKLYREKESGTAMKNLLGHGNLNWDPQHLQGAYEGQRVHNGEKHVGSVQKTTSTMQYLQGVGGVLPSSAEVDTRPRRRAPSIGASAQPQPRREISSQPKEYISSQPKEYIDGFSNQQHRETGKKIIHPIVGVPTQAPTIQRASSMGRRNTVSTNYNLLTGQDW